jgi:hypothetical protein
MRASLATRRAATVTVLLAAVASTAQAVITARSSHGSGSAPVLRAPDRVAIHAEAARVLTLDAPVPLTGWITNPNRFAVKIERIRVAASGVSPDDGGCSASIDFRVTDAVGPFVVPAATETAQGRLDWTGGSVTFTNVPGRDQIGCLKHNVLFDLKASS